MLAAKETKITCKTTQQDTTRSTSDRHVEIITHCVKHVTSSLTYLACFTSVNLAYFVWTTKFEFTDKVNQARWVKPDVMCSLIYVTTHSKPREDFKTSEKDCILSKSIFFFAEVHWVIHKNFDNMGTLSDVFLNNSS